MLSKHRSFVQLCSGQSYGRFLYTAFRRCCKTVSWNFLFTLWPLGRKHPSIDFKFDLLCRSFSGLGSDFDSIMKIGLCVGIVSVDRRFIVRNNCKNPSYAVAYWRRSLLMFSRLLFVKAWKVVEWVFWGHAACPKLRSQLWDRILRISLYIYIYINI